MGFSSDYLDYFHYSDGMGYLIFCCHSVATTTISNATAIDIAFHHNTASYQPIVLAKKAQFDL